MRAIPEAAAEASNPRIPSIGEGIAPRSLPEGGSVEVPSASHRLVAAGDTIDMGRGGNFQHFTNLEGAVGITQVSSDILTSLQPGQAIVVQSAHFRTGNPFLVGPNRTSVTNIGADATAMEQAMIGVMESRRGFVIEFSRESAFASEVTDFQPVRPGILSIPGNCTIRGTIVIRRAAE